MLGLYGAAKNVLAQAAQTLRLPWVTARQATSGVQWHNMPGQHNECCWTAVTTLINARYNKFQSGRRQSSRSSPLPLPMALAAAAGVPLFTWRSEWMALQKPGTMANDLSTLLASACYKIPLLVLDAEMSMAYCYHLPSKAIGKLKDWAPCGQGSVAPCLQY
eukprot:5749424-Amphidinium_carterae.1